MASQIVGSHSIEAQITIDIERNSQKRQMKDNKKQKGEGDIKYNLMFERNKQINNYLRLKSNRISRKLRHLSILKTEKDIGITEKPKDIKSILHSSAMLVRPLNKSYVSAKKYCEIDLKSYNVEKSSKSKCEKIVERLVNRKKGQNSQSRIFGKNDGQNLYKKYKKMQKRALTQLPKLISSSQKSIQNRKQYHQRSKANRAISQASNNYQPKIKMKSLPHKGIFNKIEPIKQLESDTIIEGSICPWMDPLGNNHIEVSTITRYNHN